LPHLNPDWFYFLVQAYQVVLEKRPLNGGSSEVVIGLETKLKEKDVLESTSAK